MVKFNEVKAEFKKHKCELLMTEEEFNQKKSRITTEKYPYTASCGHQHEVSFNNFKSKSQGRKCPKCVHLNSSKDQIEKYILNPVLPSDLEYDSIIYLRTILGDSFDVKFNGEDCLSDCCIKPKHITEDKWLMVQMKSTAQPDTILGYHFHCQSTYINCIIMCICASDKKMWIFDGNIITVKRISIGFTKKSKNNEFEITKETILDKITNYYNTFPKYDFETTDIPISEKHQLEREYRIIRETMMPFLPFIRNERQGLVYDFKVNGLKVQEKVSSQKKNYNSTQFKLNKSNGKKKSISYQQGDNDFYWLHLNNKQHFYIIPEHELLTRNLINRDKTSSITLTPNSKIGNNSWANEYLFDYTKLDEKKLKKMFHL